jgi:hypothetical protein
VNHAEKRRSYRVTYHLGSKSNMKSRTVYLPAGALQLLLGRNRWERVLQLINQNKVATLEPPTQGTITEQVALAPDQRKE